MKTIPIIVHVLYNTDAENISDEQIQSQIDVINADFSRTNANASETPPAFASVAVDTGIRFCHVLTIRKKTETTSFSNNNSAKFCKYGGNDAIDPSKYMNVWICNLGGTLLGYGEFPNTKLSDTYGVVVNYQSFGVMGTSRPPYDKGRTLTHEISHCLGLYHIFGESNNTCTKTDHTNDIPSQSSPTLGCPNFPTTDSCSSLPNGIMFMNYMDYSNDSCMNMFSKDQSDRMNAVLNVEPYNNLGNGDCSVPIYTESEGCKASVPVNAPPVIITPIHNSIAITNTLIGILLILLLLFLLMKASRS